MIPARLARLGAGHVPSPWALPRLIGWWGFAKVAIYITLAVYFVLTRELRVRLLPIPPEIPLSEVEVRWLVALLISPYLGFAVRSRIDRLQATDLSRVLPGISPSIQGGLRFLTLGLGGLAAGAALFLGAAMGEALGLGSFVALFFLLGYGGSDMRGWFAGGLLVAFLILPVAIYVLAPGLPASLGARYSWGTAALCLLLAIILFRATATPRFRPSEWPPEPRSSPHPTPDPVPGPGPNSAPDPAPHPAPPPGYRPDLRPAPGPGLRGADLISPLPAGGWARAPFRTAYRCWQMEAEGNTGISPRMAVTAALPMIALIVALVVGGVLYLGSTHLLPPAAVAARLALLAYPRSLSVVPLSRMDRAHVLWVFELCVSWGLVAAFATGLGVARLLVPEPFASGLSGPHPVLVLGILLAFFPVAGALGTCWVARGAHRAGQVGWWTLPRLLVTGILAILLIIAIPLALSMYLDQVMSEGSRLWGSAFLLGLVLVLHATALGVLRLYHARSDLGPRP